MTAADTTLARTASRAGSRRALRIFAAVAVVALLADVLSKVVVVAQLSDRTPVRLLGGAVYLVYTRNSGAAFSIGTGATVVFTVVAAVIVAVILRVARRLQSTGWAISLGLILAGALGNLGDRIFRAPSVGRGHVIDWISVFSDDGHVWPIFNLADSVVVCGSILAAVLAVFGFEINGNRARNDRIQPETTPDARPEISADAAIETEDRS